MRTSPTGFGNPWLQLALSTLCVTASEMFLKTGAMATAQISQQWGWTGVTGLASGLVWIGIVFRILSFVTWLYVLKHLPLSVAFPASQVVHVLVPLSSWWILGEFISPLRWSGIALVLAGLALVAKPAARLEEKL
ncbi:MAG: EamA family transporter [Chthoniobacterales bacterium]